MLLVARLELLDTRRSRGLIAAVLLLPLGYAVALACVPALFLRYDASRHARATYEVAVAGGSQEVERVEDVLPSRFRVRGTDDATEAVLERDGADVGLQPAEEGGYTARYVSTRRESGRAVQLVLEAFARADRSATRSGLAARQASPTLAEPFSLRRTDVVTAPGGDALLLGRWLPAALAAAMVFLMGDALRRLTSAADRRAAEALLVLPLTRRELIGGAGLATGVLAAVVLPAVVVVFAVVGAVPIGTKGPLVGLPSAIVPYLVVGGVLFGGVAIAIGLAVGSRLREGSIAESWLTGFLQPMLMAVVAAVQARPLFLRPWSPGVPVFGPLLLVQQAAAGRATTAGVVIAAVVSVAIVVVGVVLAGRWFGDERTVLRRSG